MDPKCAKVTYQVVSDLDLLLIFLPVVRPGKAEFQPFPLNGQQTLVVVLV